MQLHMNWWLPISLRNASAENLIYTVDPKALPTDPGIYVFGRRQRNGRFEALYIGKADNLQRRVYNHRKNLPLMMHLKGAKQGEKVVRIGVFKPRGNQAPAKCLPIIERALIRYFLSEGHDLANKQGTRLRRHEIKSDGRHPNKFIPKLMFVDRTRGE
jgi:hypothetical protein